MKKHSLLLITALIALGSCKKLINEPDNTIITTGVIFNNARDLDNLLYGAYGALANGNTLAGNWKWFPDALADQVALNVSEVLPADPYIDIYNRTLASAQYPENWRLAYVAIQNANTVLYAVENGLITAEKDPEFTEVVRNRIVGEAYFIRAITNFELVRLYGQQYGVNSTAASSGIILRTKPVLNVNGIEDVSGARRSTVEEVYQSVISDLTKAQDMIPPVAVRRGRATTYAAAAYLARVYFQMNDYTNALIQINKVIGSTPGLVLNGFSLVRSPATGTLTVAQAKANVQAAFNTAGTGVAATENVFDLVSVTGYLVNGTISRKYLQASGIQPHFSVSNSLITAAAFAANDQRRFGIMTTVSGKTYTNKWDRAAMNVPVIRSAELLLDRAEINALKAATDPQALADATKDINLIRDRAIPGYNMNTVITAANILAEVRRERLRELCFEGDRLHDLRRLAANVGPGDRAGVAAIPYTSNSLLLKIPDAELAASPGVVQNPN